MSTRRDIMKAIFKLSKPAAQKPLGIVPVSDVPEADQSWPPLAHSHMILYFLYKSEIEEIFKILMRKNFKEADNGPYPRWSCTIMMIARMAEITITNGHRHFDTLVQMYDRYKTV
jgi:hypothetical protein